MNISYSIPLSRAWDRMKKALFQPFDLNKWLTIGFTAWLAGLTDCHGGGNGNDNGYHKSEIDEFFRFPETAWTWLQNHPLWFNLIIIGVLVLIIIISVLIWVNSRGKFMFLSNVARDESEISKPWHEYKKEGNSLFLFKFIFGWIAGLLFILFLVYCFVTAKDLYYGGYPGIFIFWKIAGMILILIAYLIIAGYISLFLEDFVVPIMYKDRTGVAAAWYKFFPLFGRHFFTFIVYGLFILVLWIAAVIAILSVSLITCCIGLLLIIIPYIGSVVLLPVSYSFRALSIEFLAQFGEDFNVFPESKEENEILMA